MDYKVIAEGGTILRVVAGSTASGLNLPGSEDRDEMGVCVETLEAFGGFHEFEQYLYRSAAEREGKHDAPSQAGDLDLTIYGLKKFLRLALQGNPTVLSLLFVKPEDCLICTGEGRQLQELAPLIISKAAGKRYLGYMEAQRMRLLGEKGQKKINRPELEEKFGYDTKYAMHIVRLGFQGVELLTTGKISLPMSQEERDFCLAIRRGEIDLQTVLTKAGDLERELKDLLDTSGVSDTPATPEVESWMLETYMVRWQNSL